MTRTPHILVVEDDREIRTMVSRFLQKQGYRVTQSEDARSMDKALGAASIDLVLLDIMLPGGEDGLSICRRLRASSSYLLKEEGEKCRQVPGVIRRVVDPARCEGKAACVDVCPKNIFEIVRIPADAFADLSLFAKFKVWAHGMKTAATPNVAACEGCGLCVPACPERAIRLERTGV